MSTHSSLLHQIANKLGALLTLLRCSLEEYSHTENKREHQEKNPNLTHNQTTQQAEQNIKQNLKEHF
jgi:hypothetical protein